MSLYKIKRIFDSEFTYLCDGNILGLLLFVSLVDIPGNIMELQGKWQECHPGEIYWVNNAEGIGTSV